MYDVNYNRIDTISFGNINIRNDGMMETDNGLEPLKLNGTGFRVYPGGHVRVKNFHMTAVSLIVDVMGKIEADGTGLIAGGRF